MTRRYHISRSRLVAACACFSGCVVRPSIGSAAKVPTRAPAATRCACSGMPTPTKRRVPPPDAARWFDYWCQERLDWYVGLGMPRHMLRLRPHTREELSHYSAGTSDVEFLFPWGWGELEGIANRTDYDLRAHAEASGVRLEYFDQAT